MCRVLNFKRLAWRTFIVAISVILLLAACNSKAQNSRTVPALLPSPNSASPQITLFSTAVTQVYASQLDAGQAFIPVTWAVANRPRNSNLYFEQIVDGYAHNVERPRHDPYIPDAGSGIVTPIWPNKVNLADANTIDLRLSLRDITNDQIYAEAHINLPIVAGSPSASINSLTITPEVPTGREALTVSWDVSGADLVLLELSYPGRPPDYWPPERVTSNGSRTFIPPDGVQEIEFILWVNDEIRQSVTAALACQHAWFSSNADERYCPHSPAQQLVAVYQPFEQGYMISRQNYEYVWFYFNDNDSYYIMPDSAAASEVPFTETIPPGLFRPANNFGRIWEANPSLRERLGWATEPAQSYTMTYQQAPWLTITDSPLYRLFTLPDGTVIGALIDHRDGDGYSRSLPDPNGCYLFTFGIGEPFAVYAEPEMPPMEHLNIYVPANVYLPILAENGQWLQIQLPDGQPVWIVSIVGETKGSCSS